MVKHLYNVVPVICRASVLVLVIGAACAGHGARIPSPPKQDAWNRCIGMNESDWRPLPVLDPQEPYPSEQGDHGGQGIETLGVGFIPPIATGANRHLRFLRVDRFDRVFKGDVPVEILEADQYNLRGRLPNGHEVSELEWKDVTFVGKINCPTTGTTVRTLDIQARIADVRPSPGAYVYDLQLQIWIGNRLEWVDACGEVEFGEEPPTNKNEYKEVVGLRGHFSGINGSYQYWDAHHPKTRSPYISFACKRRNAAKCHDRYGYWVDDPPNPDGPPPKTTDVLHFESCIRAMKADYCGTGVSFTRNGTLIDVEDTDTMSGNPQPGASHGRRTVIPVVNQKPATRTTQLSSDGELNGQFEAAWGPEGARCTSGHYRISVGKMDKYQKDNWQKCKPVFDHVDKQCASHVKASQKFKGQWLLFTAFSPWEDPAPPSTQATRKPPVGKPRGLKQH